MTVLPHAAGRAATQSGRHQEAKGWAWPPSATTPARSCVPFGDKHGITFPLLSDPRSTTIDAWGIRNREATGRSAGIPYPGTYVIDRNGVILSRAFEEAYQERDTAASILAGLTAGGPPAATAVLGKYLSARASASDAIAAPGQRVTLFLDVTPGKNVHVYAPGQPGVSSPSRSGSRPRET